MIDYLIYLTDIGMISTSVYRETIREPESFHPPREDSRHGWVERRLKQPNELNITALMYSPDPFWIFGFELTLDGISVRFLHDCPRSIDALPKDLFAPLDEIEFKDSNTSLRRHLVFP
jgi:hypothetical protein